MFYIGTWYEVIRANKKSVTVTGWLYRGGTYVMPYHKLEGHKAAAQMQEIQKDGAKTEAESSSE